jgi:hypothetical protein
MDEYEDDHAGSPQDGLADCSEGADSRNSLSL